MPITVASSTPSSRPGRTSMVLADHATATWWGLPLRTVPAAYHQEITAQAGGPIILHVCGNCSDRLELLCPVRRDAYHFEWQVDSKEAVRRIGDRISLVATSNNPQRSLQGTPEDVHKQARYAIEAGVHLIGPEMRHPSRHALEKPESHRGGARQGY